MAKPEEKTKAIALRRTGLSVKEIARELGVSRGSVSVWVRDISLTDAQKTFLHHKQISAGHKGRMIGAAMNKEKKEARIRNAKKESEKKIKVLTRQELFYVGLGLYWGEGTKASNGIVAVANSDPSIINIMARWFEECWGIQRDRFQPRVYISDTHRDREEAIYQYWVKTLDIPRQQFGKMIFLPKTKKIYENRDVYYGVLTLRVSAGSELRHRILADIEQLRKFQKPV